MSKSNADEAGPSRYLPWSRRNFLQAGFAAAATVAGAPGAAHAAGEADDTLLTEFDYSQVLIASDLHEAQLMNTHAVLMAMSEDSLLKPFRQMAGMAAPGEDLGGWYSYDPNYDYRKNFDVGFAPGCHFGQWVSALARIYAITGDQATREKVLRLNRLYAETISPFYYDKSRFPAYTYDKLVLGLLDSHTYAKDPEALNILERTTDVALPCLPGHAVEHDVLWRKDSDKQDASWGWDESYTLSENLFLAYRRGAGRRYYELALQYLDDKTWFDPLSRNENVLAYRHAYSYVNSLNSAAMAYAVAGSKKHLSAAQNAFVMLEEQSYATGAWGPDETLGMQGRAALHDSLTRTHRSFETPCGSYAHFKLTRYLLRITRQAHYGDSMEKVMYNTVLGAKPLQDDGENFYYADYSYDAKRVYKGAHWACCSGTLPQVAADYRINTYFRGAQAVYVNLYIPSTLQWVENGATLSLTQEGEYPYGDRVSFSLTASQPTELTLHFRIPAWAQGATLSVNGRRLEAAVVPGQFAAIQREWRTGDAVELRLPLTMRIEAIDAKHPDTVALLRGPLVLMAVKPDQYGAVPEVAREKLLSARRVGERQWQVDARNGPVTLMPFTSLGELPYTTYVKLS